MKPFFRILLALVSVQALVGCGQASATAAAPRARAAQPVVARAASLPGGALSPEAAFETSFTVDRSGEGTLDLRASAPGSDWESPGREAITIRLVLDGRYNQDVVLHQGARMGTYRLALGALEAGVHQLRIERRSDVSPPGLQRVEIGGAEVGLVTADAPEYEVFANAPILYGRPESIRTDTPLVLMHERSSAADGKREIRYTPVFSNEDGGTETRALLARWGRTVDIDWAYRVKLATTGETLEASYQGFLHFTRSFKGRYEQRHPFIKVASNNNIFSDSGDSPLMFRLAPHYRLDQAETAREAVLEEYPWIYRIMAAELFREKKAVKDYYTPTAAGKGAVGDPRRLLFVEFRQVSAGRGLAIGVKLKNYPEPFLSNRGEGGLTVERSGWCRVAIELPRPVSQADIESIYVFGTGRGSATVNRVRKVVTLNEAFEPQTLPITWVGEGVVRNDADRILVYGAPAPGEPTN